MLFYLGFIFEKFARVVGTPPTPTDFEPSAFAEKLFHESEVRQQCPGRQTLHVPDSNHSYVAV
jgi:hypothetical protein